MLNKPDEGVAASPLRQLRPVSVLRLQIFSVKLLILISLSAISAIQRGYPVLYMIGFLCFWNGIFAGLAALFRQQKYDAQFLTAWDEMAAFFALALLTRLVDRIIA